MFCKKVNNVFNIKSSYSKLVCIRRSTVLSLPLQLVFPVLVPFVLSDTIFPNIPSVAMFIVAMPSVVAPLKQFFSVQEIGVKNRKVALL